MPGAPTNVTSYIGAAPPISLEFEELPTIESMNLMKVDASSFGNHEHDRSLAHVQKVIRASDFQWVVANYPAASLAALKSGDKAANPYTIINRGQALVLLGQVRNSDVEYARSQICIKKYKDQLTSKLDVKIGSVSGLKFTFDSSKPLGTRIVTVTKNDGTPIAKDSTEYTLTTLDFIIYGGDGYLNVFSPAKAKVYGALLDVFVDALKADMAAGKVTQLPALDGRVKKVN